jgi:5-hydroxyisourate hydrolase
MSGITTHVLDTAIGLPAAGVPVLLELRTDDGGWVEIGRGKTDEDGRLRTLTGPVIEAGVYRITFDTKSYDPGAFFPEVAIVFDVKDALQHYHVPLLLSGFGYSTYRGS